VLSAITTAAIAIMVVAIKGAIIATAREFDHQKLDNIMAIVVVIFIKVRKKYSQ